MVVTKMNFLHNSLTLLSHLQQKWMRYLRKEIGHYNDKKDSLDPR